MAKTFVTIQTELAEMWASKAFSSLTSGEQTQLKLRINLAKDYIVNWPKPSGGWSFLEETAYIATVAKHTTGTIALTQYSADVGPGSGGVSPAFVAGMAKYAVLIVSSGTEPYRIKTRTDGDNIVLETPYLGDTDANASYSIVYDKYTLPLTFNGIVKGSVIIDGRGQPLTYISNPQFKKQYPKSINIGTPDYYLIGDVIKSGTDIGKREIAFRAGYPETVMGVNYTYYQTVDDLSSDSDISIIGYMSGGDNALLLASIWQMKEVGEEYDMNERQAAKKDADAAIGQMWANDLTVTEDSRKETVKTDQRISNLSNW